MQGIKTQRLIHKQQGVALLMAIVIVAFVVIISANMLTQRQLQIHQTSNIYNKVQTWQYLLGAEGWAISVLAQDYKDEIKNSQAYDSFQDVWNTPLKNINQVTIAADISDLQGRFNLNNLYYRNKVQTQWLNAYRQLLVQLKLPVSLADSLLDWIDKDNQSSGTYGAEDEYYLSQEPSYRAANTPLVQLAELQWVRGYNPEVIKTLSPYVFVVDAMVPVNINTVNQTVLKALLINLEPKAIQRIMEQQKKQPYHTIEEFMNADFIKNTSIDKNLLGVSSHFFMLDARAEHNEYPMQLNTLLHRDIQGKIRIIHRMEVPLYE